MSLRPRVAVALALAAGACGGDAPSPAAGPGAASRAAPTSAQSRFSFTDVTQASGVTTVTWCGRPEKPHLLESGGDGLALFDYDGDGDLDLYLVSGWRLDGARIAERARNALWRNKGDGTLAPDAPGSASGRPASGGDALSSDAARPTLFEDVTAEAGVGDDGWGTGCAVGDFDGDGRPDLLVTNFGPDVLYHNDGGGRFSVVPDFHGIDGWSTGACFFDADGDGDLDLYVAAYVDCTLDDVLSAKPTLDWKGTKVMLGPFGLKGRKDEFFRNDGGKFVLATKEAGLTDVGEYYGFAVAAFDVDGDGALDLYVANDSNPQYLYRNDGHGHFKETGLWCGAGLSASGASQAGMGIAVGDYDADGLPDIFLTTFADDAATLYRNLGRGLFRDVSAETGVRDPTFKPLKWGTVFADFDQDGDEDLFIACGHIYPQADTAPESTTKFAQRNMVLENAGTKFKDVTNDAGPGLAVAKVSHGLAAGDIDGDGDIDLVVSNVDSTPTVLRNDAPRGAHWLMVDAPDALRVTVEAGARKQTRFHVAGGSFCSVSDARFHFGLAGAATASRVTVAWQRGGETVLTDVAADRVVQVKHQ